MTGRLEVHPEELWQAGSQLGQLAEQMASELAQLQATVTGSGNPWGGDEQGTVFAQVYGLVLGKALQALESYVDQIGYAGYGLMSEAQAYGTTDAGSQARFNAIPTPQDTL